MNHHHVMRITSQGYQALAAFGSRADALRCLLSKDCRIGAVIYRDGTTGKRYSYFESKQLAVLEAS